VRSQVPTRTKESAPSGVFAGDRNTLRPTPRPVISRHWPSQAARPLPPKVSEEITSDHSSGTKSCTSAPRPARRKRRPSYGSTKHGQPTKNLIAIRPTSTEGSLAGTRSEIAQALRVEWRGPSIFPCQRLELRPRMTFLVGSPCWSAETSVIRRLRTTMLRIIGASSRT